MKIITKYGTMLSEENPGVNVLVKEGEYAYNSLNMSNPDIVVELLNSIFLLNKKTEEYVYMITKDAKGDIIGVFEISHGTVDMSVAQPREIYLKALLCGAVSIIIAHNHPSGNCLPSNDDQKVLTRLKDAGNIIGIPLQDFIIVGGSDYFSAADKNLI